MTLQPKLIFNMETLFSGKTYISNEAVNSSYDYTAAEIDLLIKIIYFAQKQRNKGEPEALNLRLTYGQLLPNQEQTGSNYQELRRSLLGLMRKPIEVFYKDSGQYFIGSFANYVLVSQKTGLIHVEINHRMAAIFMEISQQFTSIEIESLLKLKGKYAKRLYILLMQFKATGVRYLSVDELRKFLKLDEKYGKISDIKKRVIVPAITEISQASEIIVTYETNKAGRSISDLCFMLKFKAAATETAGDTRQRAFMKICGVPDWIIENAVHTIEAGELHRILYQVQCNKDKIKNKGAYIAAMLAAAGVNTKQKLNFQPAFL